MSSMQMMAPGTAPLMVAMMVAMMLPSMAPSLWRYHCALHVARVPAAELRTLLFGLGYAAVWSTVALALTALPASGSTTWLASIIVCAGALQRSRWKARRLVRCREACVAIPRGQGAVAMEWLNGCRLGVDCVLSCAALMAILLVAGLTNEPMMALVTIAITAERLAPAGVRVARLTGGLALIAGLVLGLHAIGATRPVEFGLNAERRLACCAGARPVQHR
jgi:predicted metal-binding membrane protein